MKFKWGERVELRQSVYKEYCCISERNQGVIIKHGTLRLPVTHIILSFFFLKITISSERLRNKIQSLFHKYQTEIILSLTEVASAAAEKIRHS